MRLRAYKYVWYLHEVVRVVRSISCDARSHPALLVWLKGGMCCAVSGYDTQVPKTLSTKCEAWSRASVTRWTRIFELTSKLFESVRSAGNAGHRHARTLRDTDHNRQRKIIRSDHSHPCLAFLALYVAL